jgi:hypothetical protein
MPSRPEPMRKNAGGMGTAEDLCAAVGQGIDGQALLVDTLPKLLV